MLTIDFIKENLNTKKFIIQNNYTISNAHFNSKEITSNGLFFAFTQGSRDGHLFIQNAIENGATSIILSNPSFIDENDGLNYFLVDDTYQALVNLAECYRKTLKTSFIAITGSNGKTTTKDITYHLLSSKFKVFKTPKNLNNHIGVPLCLLHIDDTYDFAVLELGMNHFGEIDFLANLVKPDYSLITNIGDSHIEFLGSTENIAKAKGEIIPRTKNMVIINESIQHKDVLLSIGEGKNFHLVSDSLTDTNLYSSEYIQKDFHSEFKIKDIHFEMPLKGKHNLQNTLLSIELALNLGFSLGELSLPLKTLQITDMRYQILKGKNDSILINDAYNASPTSMKASISTFMLEKGNKIIILGDMFELGEASESKHQNVGEFLNNYQDKITTLITIGEDSSYISSEYKGHKHHFSTKDEALKEISNFLLPDHSLLFKASRGMALETLVKQCI